MQYILQLLLQQIDLLRKSYMSKHLLKKHTFQHYIRYTQKQQLP
jgi:hypothetical protein